MNVHSQHTPRKCADFTAYVYFCFANNRRCMPMLIDTIKHYGGSSKLIRVLNRVGVVASEDTHARLVTYVSEKRKREIKEELNMDAFTVCKGLCW